MRLKNTRPDEICEKNPRAYINGLVNLKDVDTAKELLTGRKIYVQSDMARVDDANSYSGYRKVSIPVNTEATITAIGVGSQSYPVKNHISRFAGTFLLSGSSSFPH